MPHDKSVSMQDKPKIKACLLHPTIVSVVTCEHPGNKHFKKVRYGMCMFCSNTLNKDINYIMIINKEIEDRLEVLGSGE